MFATHHFALAEAEHAYDVFGAAAETHALKVVLDGTFPSGTSYLRRNEELAVGV